MRRINSMTAFALLAAMELDLIEGKPQAEAPRGLLTGVRTIHPDTPFKAARRAKAEAKRRKRGEPA